MFAAYTVPVVVFLDSSKLMMFHPQLYPKRVPIYDWIQLIRELLQEGCVSGWWRKWSCKINFHTYSIYTSQTKPILVRIAFSTVVSPPWREEISAITDREGSWKRSVLKHILNFWWHFPAIVNSHFTKPRPGSGPSAMFDEVCLLTVEKQ